VCGESRMHGVKRGKTSSPNGQNVTYRYPNMLDCTTLSDGMEKRIPGILQSGDGYSFTANYTPANFAKVKALVGHQYDYALWLGGTSTGEPDGHNGKFSWTGDVVVGFPGKGVDEVQDMSITAVPSTDTVWTEN